LKVISPYAIIGYSRLYYHRLFVVILLVANVGYYINGYWCLYILLVAIIGYYIGGYWCLFYWWLLVTIGAYFIGDFWCLFY